MYVQCSTVIRKGKVSRNRKLVESYRDPNTKKPRTRTVQKVEKLPILERAKLIYEHGGIKHLTSEEWIALDRAGLIAKQSGEYCAGDLFRGAGTAVAYHHMNSSGLFGVLDKHLSRRSFAVLRELIIHQLIDPTSKLGFVEQRKNSALYLLGGKLEYSEDSIYRTLDELNEKFEQISKALNQLQDAEHARVLLYDLSNSYFTGTKAELGGRGHSKEKRHDRYIVTYGLITNDRNMPLGIKIWKGGTADAKTVSDTFTDWKKSFNAQQAIWIADRGMSGETTIDEIKQLKLNFITGLPGSSQQALLLLKHEEQPELFDKMSITSFEDKGIRYLICRHHSKGYRKEKIFANKRRRAYNELVKIQNSPQNKNEKKLYHRAMRVIEKYAQTPFWTIQTTKYTDKKGVDRFRINFTLDRKTTSEHNKIGHYYILQTDVKKQELSDQCVLSDYKSLMQVERSFRDIKSQIQIRPIRHWKERRIKGHIYLCYLSLWLSKYIQNKWNDQNEHQEVGRTLLKWDDKLRLCETLDSKGHLIEINWNQGAQAKLVLEAVSQVGDVEALKQFS